MQDLLIRLLIVALAIWLGEKILGVIPLSPQARQILVVLLIVLAVLWLIFGTTFIG
jgi:hypothetical protein